MSHSDAGPLPIEAPGAFCEARSGIPAQPVLEFWVYGEPKPQGSKKAFVNPRTQRAVLVESSKGLRPWRQDLSATAMAERPHGWELLDGAIALELEFRLPRRKKHGRRACTPDDAAVRPDSSKLLRAVEDALSGVLIWDDARITDHVIRKRIADVGQSPGVRIRISRAT